MTGFAWMNKSTPELVVVGSGLIQSYPVSLLPFWLLLNVFTFCCVINQKPEYILLGFYA